MLRSSLPAVRRNLPRLVLALTLAAAGLAVLPKPAYAATTLNVSTTADIAANAGACGNPSITTPPSPLSLREATCLANNLGGTVTIAIPAGTYNLTNGELAPGIDSGQNITMAGAGAASTTIDGRGVSRVLDLDSFVSGGVNVSISDLTITGGADSDFGGAGIIAGSNNSTTSDTLALDNVVVTGNVANGSSPDVTNNPGGGIQFLGGRLTVSNSTISNNSSGSSYGSGLAYGANGDASPEGLTITNTVFSGNATSNTSSDGVTPVGGALAVFGTPTSTFSVTNTRFVNNTATSAGSAGPAAGAAILQQSGALTVTGSTFTGNSATGGTKVDTGGAIDATTGTTTLHVNRFVGNIAASGSAVHTVNSLTNATDNWWGCNGGPGTAGCDTVAGTVAVSPRLLLSASASPATVNGPNATSTINASLATDSSGTSVGGSSLSAFDTLPATFSDPAGDATVTTAAGAHPAAFASGRASIDYHSNTTTGPSQVNVTFDNATVTATVTVNQPPAITSPNSAHFTVGSAGAFTVTTTGYPNPAISETGTLPPGLTFTDNGDGTATLAGTATGSGGTFPLTLTAANGAPPNATQTLTVSVGRSPAFTSASTATFTTGSAGSFTVTTSGIPTVTSITESGSLPSGVTFTDNGNGTATLAGTPAPETGGTYPVTLTATNGVSPNATQTLMIQVNQAPAVTADPNDQTVNAGTSVTFTAAASGVPTPTVQWQRSTDGGNNYGDIAGATGTSYTLTAAAGDDGNRYRAVFTNVAGAATSGAATLHVGTAPAFTSSNVTTFTVGDAGSFLITTTGMPSATLTRSGSAYPAWLTLTENGDGTGTLTGTPPAGSGGQYTFTLKAANGFSPSPSQTFTLTVDDSPRITSGNRAVFTAGQANSFAVTTTAGYPTSTTIDKSGALPPGVTLTDNGDGTATLAGTPASGSGGTYNFTITAMASGGQADPATQSFTLTVLEAPHITSTDHATFGVGTAGSFTVITSPGSPPSTTISHTGALPPGLTFTDNGDGTATIAGTPDTGTGGVYTLTIRASNGVGSGDVQSFTLTVNEPPHITSADHATFAVATAAAFTVTTAAGSPTGTTISEVGALPGGVTFTDNGDGTATLGGTPTEGGTFALTLTASNGVHPDATQSFTLTVDEPPAITSADHAAFAVGTSGSFTVTTDAGVPTATTITENGALPDGVTFTDNGDGTAAIAGTAAGGTGGVYSLTITATNGVNPDATQTFTLSVLEPPSITSADRATFTIGASNTFTVTTDAGYPDATTITETGALPVGVTFTDNGDGTATIAGTPAAGGSFPLTITASNGVDPDATQAFTLTVTSSPTITSADHATFTVGSAGTFTVTTAAGSPPDTAIGETGDLPDGVTFTDNGDGTATLAGTPAAGTGAGYQFAITASNGVEPDATQVFTLTVTDTPTLTNADHATFTVGTAGSFTVTSSAGFPATSTLTETGTLPAGVLFTDNGDGTATLAGTPDAGSGGSYPLIITATNSAGHDDQAFTLTVDESTAITSADHTTFTAGTSGTFTVETAGGFPTPPSLTADGALPDGVTFTDNGDGTATLSGQATSGGVYPLTITAATGHGGDTTQSFTLTVNGPPSITSDPQMTFSAGLAGTFTVTTRAGVPATTTIGETGDLPAGVTFTDNGDGTATLAGTAPVAALGTYDLVVTADNGVGSGATQQFTLTVARATPVDLPAAPPVTDGPLHGVPTKTLVGQVLHLSGDGFAAGAPITIGVYSSPTKLAGATADATGHFAADVTVPSKLGRHVFLAAGIGADAAPRYLDDSTVVGVAPTGGGSSTSSGSAASSGSGSTSGGDATSGDTGANGGGSADSNDNGLAGTGPVVSPATAIGWGGGLLLLGLLLLLVCRRVPRPGRHR